MKKNKIIYKTSYINRYIFNRISISPNLISRIFDADLLEMVHPGLPYGLTRNKNILLTEYAPNFIWL